MLTGEFPEPKPHKPRSHRLEDALKKRIQRLRRQGYKLAAIAKMTNTPFTTVRRIPSSQSLEFETDSVKR